MLIAACTPTHEHIAEAIDDRDSLPMMSAHGISNLISDSGLISYKIVAEDWNIYTTQPQKWTFLKGLFLEKFDEKFHVEWHVQADTAYCHDNRTWELRGRVVILNQEGVLFKSEEFFWDMNAHLIWSNMFVDITTPDRDLRGTRFRSNEQMTDWYFDNASGSAPFADKDNDKKSGPAAPVAPTANSAQTSPTQPAEKNAKTGTATTPPAKKTRPMQTDKHKHGRPATVTPRISDDGPATLSTGNKKQ